ncbi:hypothetical protein V5799_031029 [Amblyomma americanum]|uniref:Uncharacterized protein n=1 Tax=Amblyomma americanum TaxID=6943 RepID=A0AAQ4ELL2_AMBAM
MGPSQGCSHRKVWTLTWERQHSGDPDSRSAYFEGQVDRLHSMVTDPVLYNWQDCVDRTSDVIHHVCEEVHHIISKEPHSCPARHDLVKVWWLFFFVQFAAMLYQVLILGRERQQWKGTRAKYTE